METHQVLVFRRKALNCIDITLIQQPTEQDLKGHALCGKMLLYQLQTLTPLLGRHAQAKRDLARLEDPDDARIGDSIELSHQRQRASPVIRVDGVIVVDDKILAHSVCVILCLGDSAVRLSRRALPGGFYMKG